MKLDTIHIPKYYSTVKEKVLILDNLQKYIEKDNFSIFLERILLDKNIRIIATCRSGYELKKTKNKLIKSNDIDIDNLFHTIDLEEFPITKDNALQIAKEVNLLWEDIRFNGNIGSIFLPLNEMNRRYSEECDRIHRNLLKAIKIAEVLGLDEGISFYRKNWVKLILQKDIQKKVSDFNLNSILDVLVDLEFIKVINNYLLVEEVYLENIVDHEIYLDDKDYKSYLEIFSNEFLALYLIGNSLLIKNLLEKSSSRFSLLAVDYYKKARKINPQNLEVLNNLGLAYESLNMKNDAIKSFKAALKINQNQCEVLNNLALLYRDKNNINKFIENLEKALDVNPNFANALFNLGIFYKEKKDFDNALHYLLRFHKLYSMDFRVLYSIGDIYGHLNDFKKAIHYYEEALEINSEKVEVLYNLGVVYQTVFKLSKAIRCFNKVIKYEPDNYIVWSLLGDIYLKKNEPRIALECFKEAIDINSEYTPAKIGLSIALGVCIKTDEVLIEALELMKEEPQNSERWLHLALIYFYRDNKDDASKALQKSIKYNPNIINKINTLPMYRELRLLLNDS